jgi:hypothetical protein
MKKIGLTFSKELEAAGLLGLPFSWGEDGNITFSEEITSNQRAAIISVYEAHNPTPAETPEEVIARLEGALDRHLDEVANEYRYESIRTMVTYATSEHPDFGKEGRAAVAYRDAVYGYGIQCITDVNAGLRTIPTEAELIAELPPFSDFLA